MRVERKVHHVWSLWDEVKDTDVWKETTKKIQAETRLLYPAPVIGKWHYHYYSDDGKKHISLVELLDYAPWRRQGSEWEICSGGTCSNCADAEERFDSIEEAEVRIKELIGEEEIRREWNP